MKGRKDVILVLLQAKDWSKQQVSFKKKLIHSITKVFVMNVNLLERLVKQRTWERQTKSYKQGCAATF